MVEGTTVLLTILRKLSPYQRKDGRMRNDKVFLLFELDLHGRLLEEDGIIALYRLKRDVFHFLFTGELRIDPHVQFERVELRTFIYLSAP